VVADGDASSCAAVARILAHPRTCVLEVVRIARDAGDPASLAAAADRDAR
jgi:hypothetical protein